MEQHQDKNVGGRPEGYTVSHFPHYSIPPKILISTEHKFGITGYAVFFKLEEILGKTKNHFVDIREDDDKEYFLSELNIDDALFHEIGNYLAKKKFIDDKLYRAGIIYSQPFVDSLKYVYQWRKNSPLSANEIYSMIFEKGEKENRENSGSSLEVYYLLKEKRKKEAKKENSELNRSEIEVKGSELKETQVSQKETLDSQKKTKHTPEIIINNDFDELGSQLVEDEKYISSKVQITGFKAESIKGLLISFAKNVKGLYKSRSQFDLMFDQALKINKDELKAQDVDAAALAKPGNTGPKQPPPLNLPPPDESRLDDICRAVLDDRTWVYNTCLKATVRQDGHSYNLNKDQNSILVKLFANEHYNQFATVKEFKRDFNLWVMGVEL